MKGLLLKEWYTQKHTFLACILCGIVHALHILLVTSHPVDDKEYIIPLFFTWSMYIMTVSSIKTDQQTKWTTFAGALPCSPRQIVLAKYIFPGIALCFYFIMSIIAYYHGTTDAGTFDTINFLCFLLTKISIYTIPFYFIHPSTSTSSEWKKNVCIIASTLILTMTLLNEKNQQPRFPLAVTALLAIAGIWCYLRSAKKTIEWYQLASK